MIVKAVPQTTAVTERIGTQIPSTSAVVEA